MATCQVKMREDRLCGRNIYAHERCILHCEIINKDINLFNSELSNILEDKSSEFHDFTRLIFPKDTLFPKLIKKTMFFEFGSVQGGAPFLGVVFEKPVHFGGTKFHDTADFRDVEFRDEATFGGCDFVGAANFLGVTFKAGATFSGTTFHKEALFRSATFRGESWFGSSKFVGRASFYSTVFQGSAYFADAVFQSAVSFLSSRFEAEAVFYNATFKDRASFADMVFKGRVYLLGANFENRLLISRADDASTFFENEVDFRQVKLLKPEMVTLYKVGLHKTRFLLTDLRKVEFLDVDWYKEKGKGRNKIYDEVSPDPETKSFDYPLIGQVYKRLRANYEENLNYAEAGDFHIGEMEMRRKGEKNIFNKGIIWLYKLISNYGESYWLPLGWIALLLLIFPFLYMLVGITSSTNVDINQNFETLRDYGSSLTFSLSVFSLVREKPYHTINNLGHILTVLESIFSPVMIAFFLLALRRRFKR